MVYKPFDKKKGSGAIKTNKALKTLKTNIKG